MATTTKPAADAPADTKPDPVGKTVEPEKVKTIEDEGIGVRDPYPEGGAPDPEDAFFAAHGFRRAKP